MPGRAERALYALVSGNSTKNLGTKIARRSVKSEFRWIESFCSDGYMDWYIKSFAVRIDVWMKGRKSNAFKGFLGTDCVEIVERGNRKQTSYANDAK